jgi:hypothetical protein
VTVPGSAESRSSDSAVAQTGGIDTARRTEEWYAEFYKDKGTDRNDLLRNPEVLFQFFAHQASMISAAPRRFDPVKHTVLDVGCGGGPVCRCSRISAPGWISCMSRHQESRVQMARSVCRPRISCGDASAWNFPTDFRCGDQSTMFVQLTDEHLAQRIADEIIA